jgi:2'-5' RNA ligase
MIDPTSSKTTGFHLFFEPAGELASELGAIIENLSKEYGGPVFAPHITLLARIPAGNDEDVVKKTQALADMLAPFSLTLGELDAQDAFFKALYIRIQEREEMDKYHAYANKIFSMKDESPYLPHLSLLYGNYEQKRKQQTIGNLAIRKGTSFRVDKIHLYRTEGEVEYWQKVREFALKG